MTAAFVVLWLAAVLLAALHVAEHHAPGSVHAARWRAQPPAARAGLMTVFFLAVAFAVVSWWVVPAVTLALFSLADLAGVVHLTRHWRSSS